MFQRNVYKDFEKVMIPTPAGEFDLKQLYDEHNSSKSDSINALAYGFVSDGSTPNDTILDYYIAHDSDKELYFPKGEYCFASSINFVEKMKIKLNSEAVWKYIGDKTESFITVNKDKLVWSQNEGCYITGGTLDGNDLVDYIFVPRLLKQCLLSYMNIKNFLKYGIYNGYATPNGACWGFYLYISNDHPHLGTYGIYDSKSDNRFQCITVRDTQFGFASDGGQFWSAHHWISFQELLPGSASFCPIGTSASFTDAVADTAQYAVYTPSEGMGAMFTNLSVMFNTNIYSPEYQVSAPVVLFKGHVKSRNIINGAVISVPFNMSVADNELSYSFISNVRIMKNSGIVLTQEKSICKNCNMILNAGDFAVGGLPFATGCIFSTNVSPLAWLPFANNFLLQFQTFGKLLQVAVNSDNPAQIKYRMVWNSGENDPWYNLTGVLDT